MPKSRGFTLVELLVVIAIIGILASLGSYGFSTAQKKARDAQRKNDLKEVKQALEAYAGANNGFFPPVVGTSYACSHNHSSIFQGDCSETTPGVLCPYLSDPSKIDDPKSTTKYSYGYVQHDTIGDKIRTAVVFARLEGEAADKELLVVCTNGITKQISPYNLSGEDVCENICGAGNCRLYAIQVCAGRR